MKISLVIIILFLFGGVLRAQEGLPDITGFKEDQIVAQIDTIAITAREFYYSYEYGPAFVKRNKDSRSSYLNYMINEKLLALDGYSRNIDKLEEAESMLEEFKSDLAAEELFKQDVLSKAEISEEEIDTAIVQKSLDVEIKWIYSNSKKEIDSFYKKLLQGDPFDSLFSLQLSDSVFVDERSLKLNRFKLGQMNPGLVKIIDTMKIGAFSPPVYVKDGWYIIKLVNLVRAPILTETEYARLKQETVNALIKKKMDVLSDLYVHSLMLENEPVIKRKTFTVLRSYMAYYFAEPEKYKEWNKSGVLNMNYQNIDSANAGAAELVELKNGSFSMNDFIYWYRNRSLYIHLNNKDIQNFSAALESMIWQMIRDRLLAAKAKERGLDKLADVKVQSSWWRDKITSSMVKNEIRNSIEINFKEVNVNEDKAGKLGQEYNARLLRKILSLKKKHVVEINNEILNAIPVSSENDPKTIDFYTVKKGGLIPRTPYPAIDYEWINWE